VVARAVVPMPITVLVLAAAGPHWLV
jgi:hypothetical protein